MTSEQRIEYQQLLDRREYTAMQCATCKYHIDVINQSGKCVRYPQTVQKDNDDWCGEYRAQKPKPEIEQKDAQK